MLIEVSRSEKDVLACGCVAIAALATAWNNHENDFVWDDRSAILSNKDVRSDGTGSALWELFVHDFWGMHIRSATSHKSYRPLTVLTFRGNHFWQGGSGPLEAWHFHVVNTIAHAMCAILVWKIAAILLIRYRNQTTTKPGSNQQENENVPPFSIGALFAGLVFAVHPIHCDAVASVVGRADLLCTALSLLAFLAYLRAVNTVGITNWTQFTIAMLLTVAASLCKELGFTTFGLFIAYDTLLVPLYRCEDPKLRALRARMVVLMIIALSLVALRVWINGEHRHMKWNILANNVAVQPHRWTRLLSYAHIHSWYLWKLIWPRWLCFDYGFNTIPVITSLADPKNLYTFMAYLVALCGVVIGFRQLPRSPLLLICIAFGVVPFVPVSNIFFPVGTVVAERLLYFPSVGFCFLLGYVLQQTLAIIDKYASSDNTGTCCHPQSVRRRIMSLAHRSIRICCGLLLLFGCYRSRIRNTEWKSEDSLFRAAVQVVPTNAKVLSNTAKTLLNSDPDQALEYLRVALGLLPTHIEGNSNCGLAYVNKKNMLLAIRHLLKATKFGATQFPAPGYLGEYLYEYWSREHRTSGFTLEEFLTSPTIKAATTYLDHAIDMKSIYPSHFYNRGGIAYDAQDYETAISHFRATEQANEIIRKRNVDPELLVSPGSIYNMIAITFKRMRREQDALELLVQGMKIAPDEIDLYVNAALIHMDRKELERASQYLQTLLNIVQPYQVDTLEKTRDILHSLGHHEAAAVFHEKAVSIHNNQ